MPRSKLYLLALSLGIGVSGCSRPPILVYVDTNKIKQIDFAASAPLPIFKESLFPAKKVTLPGSIAKEMVSFKEEANEKLISDLLQKQQDQLYAETLKDLEKIQLAHIYVLEKEGKEKISLEEKNALDRVYGKLHEILLSYAGNYGKALYRLAAIEGFPDPDPHSFRLPDPRDLKAVQKYNEAKKLRKELNEIDKEFYQKFNNLLNNVKDEANLELTDLEKTTEKLREEVRLKAEKEAKALTASNFKRVVLEKKNRIQKMPALLKEEVMIPSKKVVFKAITPPSQKNFKEFSTLEMQSQVELWADVHGYQLSKIANKAIDKTVEFIKWRNHYELEFK